jgi:hypothetical protein
MFAQRFAEFTDAACRDSMARPIDVSVEGQCMYDNAVGINHSLSTAA